MRRAVCVTGMHRSGTSFAARVLEVLGVSFGLRDRLMAPGPDNPSGYWENRDIKELDDEVLGLLGGSWDQPPVLDPGWEHAATLDPLRLRAQHILDDAFGTPRSRPRLIGWKDPRLSLLLPFWRTVTPITTTILVVRDPAEVAASLRARNGIERPQAALLWLRYVFAACANDPGALVVDYRTFFVDLPRTLTDIATHLGLARPGSDALADAHDQLDPSLRHHTESVTGVGDDNPLVALAAAVWNGGAIALDVLPAPVGQALGRGWLRPPIDGELLARARAEVITMRDRIRQRRRQERAVHPTASRTEPIVESSAMSAGEGATPGEDGDA